MKSSSAHKWIRRSLIALATAVLLVISLYFLLEFQAMRIVKYVVEKQSNGQYLLDADQLNLSFGKRRVNLTNASIQQVNSETGNTTSQINLPSLHLQLNSWSALLFQKKLIIDSLTISSPSFEKWNDSASATDKISFETANIFSALQKTVDLLNVHFLKIEDGSFILHSSNSSDPLSIRHIGFSILNFNRSDDSTHRFMSADDIELSIPEQDLKLDNGNRQIKFKRLAFSGKNQYFELDSCYFMSYNPLDESGAELTADKFSFRSDSLFALYENNKLILDTLLCKHPVFKIRSTSKQSGTDTAEVIHQSLKTLLTTDVSVRHLFIDDGQFAVENVKDQKVSNYTTQKTDLRIDDLSFQPNNSPFLRVGNIDLQLRQLLFYTPDSMYELRVAQFNMLNNNLQFKKAIFGPTSKNHEEASFQVAIPTLELRDLNFEDLIQNKLNAGVAEMDSPVVTIRSARVSANDTSKVNLSAFYDALHGLSQLLTVKLLYIANGNIFYQSQGDANLNAELLGLNASISLNDFLNSASLIDIKHSIPFLRVDDIHAKSKNLNASLNELNVLGAEQRNSIHALQLQLTNGMTIKGEELFWQKLDWDSLKNAGAIILDSMSAVKLFVLNSKPASNKKQVATTQTVNASPKNLPLLRIRKLNVDALSLNYSLPAGKLISATGQNILLSDVSTVQNKLRWSNAEGDFSKLSFKSPQVNVSVNSIHLNTGSESKLLGVKANVNNLSEVFYVSIPELNWQGTIHSSDFSALNLSSLTVNNPQVSIAQVLADSETSKPLKIPLDLAIKNLSINQGEVHFQQKKGIDSVKFFSLFNVTATSFIANKEKTELSSFDEMDWALSNLAINNGKMTARVPAISFGISNGSVSEDRGKISLGASVSSQWNDLALQMKFRKGSQLSVEKFSGSLAATPITFNPTQKIQWRDWAEQTNISDGKILFSDSGKDIAVSKIMWNPATGSLHLDSLSLIHKDSAGVYLRTAKWQTDYINLLGGFVTVSGIDWNAWKQDSVFSLQKVTLQSFAIDVSRDKRIPFQHGIDKLMPTKLIQSFRTRFSIDSVIMHNGSLNYHEYSSITNREGTVPLQKINAIVKNVKNYGLQKSDSLVILGKMELLNSNIRKFRYQESYQDSLASFKMSVKASPTSLTDFSKITNPLAAVDVQSGMCDTMAMRVAGNKYASIGNMQFYYRNLKVNLLDRQDTMSKKLSLAFINFIANKFVIRSNNNKHSQIFFIRDQEKFVFNYWIKTLMSGVMTSAGVKSNKKFKKQYQSLKKEYSLPDDNF